MNINKLIEQWIILTPYPHIDDDVILKNIPNGCDKLEILKKILSHVFEFDGIVRKKYLSVTTMDSSNTEIKEIFDNIRKDLGQLLLAENNEITIESYYKLIDVLIYNCYMH